MKSALVTVGVLLASVAFAERTEVDFTQPGGTIRRALHSSGWGGQLVGYNTARYEQLKALNFKAARTHDWALNNPGQRICDLHFIFPLLHADTKDPKNYFFGPTDEIFAMTIEDLDMDILFRMGTSIESVNYRRGSKKRPSRYYNSVEPADWEQFAKAHAQIIRHYTEGWANGFKWGDRMKYWELWNEPNDQPGGSWIRADGIRERKSNYERFWQFAVFVLKHLKAEFPHLKFGAPATCYLDKPFLTGFLTECKKEGYTPDFVSWHSYGFDPIRMLAEPATVRQLVDSFGFTKAELFLDEWHYVPKDECWGWFGADPKTFGKLLSPDDGLKSADSAIYALQVMMGVQQTCLDQSYYYGCSHDDGFWGCRNADNSLDKSYCAIRFFGEVVGACEKFAKGVDVTVHNPVRAFGAWSRDGKTIYLIATAYRGREPTFEVEAKGLKDWKIVSARRVGKVSDGEAVDIAANVTRAGDVFTFRKESPLRACAYLLTFEQ